VDSTALVQAIAAEHGFSVVGVTSAEPLEEALRRLTAWSEAGHGGEMGYMTRNPPERADARTLMKTVRSVISVAVDYWSEQPPFVAEGRYGRVARYAWGRDYHDVVIPRLQRLGDDLAGRLGSDRRARVACDYAPLLERAAAVRAGLGFFGKNTCLLMPRRGSWFFLGEILLDVELASTPPQATDHCGTCADCLGACPTDAFVAPFVLDARKCISYLTIEQGGPIPPALRAAVGAWVFGCDDCQEVCPFNRFTHPATWPELGAQAGVGPRLDLAETLALETEEDFRRRFAGTPLLRARRTGLLRNAAVVARNVGATNAVPALVRCARDDADPLVRGHAIWALAGLDPRAARLAAERALGRRAGAFVQGEARAVLDRLDPATDGP
jgi:epoxyqueuosine reductase